MLWLPESPRWLLARSNDAEGESVIAALRGIEVDAKETQLQKQIILDSIRASGYAGRKDVPLKAVFTGGRTQHFRRMMLGVSSQFMQQVGGCNAVIYYFPILFEKSIHQTHNISLLLGGVNMIVYAIFATVSWFIIERVGRRKLFLWVVVMITPIMITNIGWGTYLFFAIVNACFLPIIYFTYPETKLRSLEEIDIIFAKGYADGGGIVGRKYVQAARSLPLLSDEEIDSKAREYGLVLDDKGPGEEMNEVEKGWRMD
ncbi:MAG: hypothetical protein Q9214_007805 [Letrouitia sp. 1 TL-2023]